MTVPDLEEVGEGVMEEQSRKEEIILLGEETESYN